MGRGRKGSVREGGGKMEEGEEGEVKGTAEKRGRAYERGENAEV